MINFFRIWDVKVSKFRSIVVLMLIFINSPNALSQEEPELYSKIKSACISLGGITEDTRFIYNLFNSVSENKQHYKVLFSSKFDVYENLVVSHLNKNLEIGKELAALCDARKTWRQIQKNELDKNSYLERIDVALESRVQEVNRAGEALVQASEYIVRCSTSITGNFLLKDMFSMAMGLKEESIEQSKSKDIIENGEANEEKELTVGNFEPAEIEVLSDFEASEDECISLRSELFLDSP